MDINGKKAKWFIFSVLGLLVCSWVAITVVVFGSPRVIHQSQREQWLRKAVGEVLFFDVSSRVEQITRTEAVGEKELFCFFDTLFQNQNPQNGDKELVIYINPAPEIWMGAWSNFLNGNGCYNSDRTAFYLQTNPDFAHRWYAMDYGREWRTASFDNVRANLPSNFIKYVFYYDGDYPAWKSRK